MRMTVGYIPPIEFWLLKALVKNGESFVLIEVRDLEGRLLQRTAFVISQAGICWTLTSAMEKALQMYMATARGLPA